MNFPQNRFEKFSDREQNSPDVKDIEMSMEKDKTQNIDHILYNTKNNKYIVHKHNLIQYSIHTNVMFTEHIIVNFEVNAGFFLDF